MKKTYKLLVLAFTFFFIFSFFPFAKVFASSEEKECREYTMNLKLLPILLSPKTNVVGELCWEGTLEGKTLQVLVNGATYARYYWDLPIQSETYSYVNKAISRGYATFNFDRPGSGESDFPLSLLVTIDTEAYLLHQIVAAFKAGQYEQTNFNKVVTVGHSLGSGVAIHHAGLYPNDVNGLIVTGFIHYFSTNAMNLMANMHAANNDPVFAGKNVPLGYLTTVPGTRGGLFYNQDLADQDVIDYDEAHKGTLSAGETTLLLSLISSELVTDKVFVLMGENDDLFCSTPIVDCSNLSQLMAFEKTFYLLAPSVDVDFVPDAGHNLSLQTNAQVAFTKMLDWIDANI